MPRFFLVTIANVTIMIVPSVAAGPGYSGTLMDVALIVVPVTVAADELVVAVEAPAGLVSFDEEATSTILFHP